MSIINLDHIQLDPGDMGIQFIPGIGFRPVDMTEELPFYNKLNCEMVVGKNQCTKGTCSGKSGKYDTPFISTKYESPLIPYAPAYNPSTFAVPYIPEPVFSNWELSEFTTPFIPTTTCCKYTTPTPEVPASVPLTESVFFMLTALMALTLIRKLT